MPARVRGRRFNDRAPGAKYANLYFAVTLTGHGNEVFDGTLGQMVLKTQTKRSSRFRLIPTYESMVRVDDIQKKGWTKKGQTKTTNSRKYFEEAKQRKKEKTSAEQEQTPQDSFRSNTGRGQTLEIFSSSAGPTEEILEFPRWGHKKARTEHVQDQLIEMPANSVVPQHTESSLVNAPSKTFKHSGNSFITPPSPYTTSIGSDGLPSDSRKTSAPPKSGHGRGYTSGSSADADHSVSISGSDHSSGPSSGSMATSALSSPERRSRTPSFVRKYVPTQPRGTGGKDWREAIKAWPLIWN